MKLANVDFPKPLLDALRDNKLVVFAGAGVSMGEPARLPEFKSLTAKIAERANKVQEDGENLEQFLGRLQDDGVKVHDIAKSVLSPEGLKPTSLHSDLLRLYRKEEPVRLVTTNFDLLFEQVAEELFDNAPEVFHAPALPLGHQFSGIIHMHGCICHHDQMVITDRDFGRAYLNEGWGRRFLLGLFNTFTVLFVGYSHSDTVLNYLVRALPPKREFQRYALIADSECADHQHWKYLDIETIPYPQHENDHTELNAAISNLADYVRRGMVGWHREITAIAETLPPHNQDKEIESLIESALEDKTKTQFFTQSASYPEWIEWFDKRGHLTPLFGNGQLRESDKVLSLWLAGFVFKHAHPLFLLISKHNTCIHPTFWQHIAWKIERHDESSLDTNILSRWISLLLSTAPDEGETPDGSYVFTSNLLASIARRCIPHQMIQELLLIFDAMIQSRVLIRENHYLPRGETDRDLQISLEMPLASEHNELNELWKKGLKPNLSQITLPLLERVTWCLENQYFFHHTWGRATRFFEHTSEMRSAIECHQQNVGHDIDVVIDVARDSLDWLTTHELQVATQWCNRLVKSDAPLLRRLAVYSLSKRKDLTPDDKIQWLLKHIDMHDSATHHEVYQAVRHAYPGAGSDCRMALIEKVGSYRFPHEEHPDNEETTAKEHLYWFDWLHKSDPACSLAKQARDEVLAKYPHLIHFIPEHSDFTSYIRPGGYVDLPCPLTPPEDLLANPTVDSINQYSSLEAPTLRREMERLADAIRQDFKGSLNLANKLAEYGQWDVCLWRSLIGTWGKMELDIKKHSRVLQWLARTELYSQHSYEISDCLYALVKNGAPSYTFQLLPQANKIAEELWKSLDRAVSINVERGWFNASDNYPVWALTNFWLSAASLWRRQQDPEPATLSEDYHRPLIEIIKDSSPIGSLGKSILAGQLTFLLAVDEEWTRKHLLPLFELGSADFQAAWDGFVTVGRLSPPVADALKGQFINAVTRISTDLCYQRHGFVECYTVMLIYAADDVLGTWIPKLFEHGSHQSQPTNREPTLLRDDNRTIPEIFALKVTKCLEHMDDSEKQELWKRWLKEYWQDRLNGKPAPLTPNESHLMLDWLPELNTEFPEAVALAIDMPPPSLKHTRILARLVVNETWRNHPAKAVAKLLIYLWESNMPQYEHDTMRKMAEPLLAESNIPPELKQKLEEIKIQL